MGNVHFDRIEELRSMMQSHGWDALVLTGSDPHASEYPCGRWKQIQWLSGFTGEAAEMVVTAEHAGLWTDSRFFLQAEKELDGTGVVLHKTRVSGEISIPYWLRECFKGEEEVFIAVDGLCISATEAEGLEKSVPGCELVSIPDILSGIWKDRPNIPQTPVFSVNSGQSREERLGAVRDFIIENEASSMLVSRLDEIAWILNLRASDIEYNPLVISYLIVTPEDASLYVLKDDADPESLETCRMLEGCGVRILPYAQAELGVEECERPLIYDGSSLNCHFARIAKGGESIDLPSPVAGWKAVKNTVEKEGMVRSHILDGVAVEKFLWWLEKSLDNSRTVTERDAAIQLGKFRSEADAYTGDSFETISAYGPGAALPHYSTPKENPPVLEQRGLYLCDSGAQYCCPDFMGTTDITRTIPLGECSMMEKEDYTLVLKGHIDLAKAVFPEGTPGCRLDALARAPLWSAKRNFGHGTGHGVGCFLGVHEGPQDVRQNLNPQPLMEGMIISDEPGIYREGEYGIRHENLLLCVRAGGNEFGEWLRFEPLTLCHFDTSAIMTELLDREEREWLNEYNERVYRTLSPLLDEETAEWLRRKTLPV